MKEIFDSILAKHKEGLAEVSQLGLSTGKKLERRRIVKLIEQYGIKHNSYPYFVDIIKLIEGDDND
jgi:hypothetical protein